MTTQSGTPAVLTITLPIPDPLLTGNGRKRRTRPGYKTALANQYGAWAYFAAIEAVKQSPPMMTAARVTVRWYRGKGGRCLDRDNALVAFKEAFDSFTRAGVWKDDRHNRYDVEWEQDAKNPRVEVEVVER